MTQFDRLADEICENSAGPVFGVPGSGATLTLIDKLEHRGREFVLTHFEGAGAMMAGTVGRLSGRAGVAMSIKGPGVTNMVPGLAVSFLEAYPMVAVVEAYGEDASAAKAHKRIDQAALTSTVCKGITQSTAKASNFFQAATLAGAETPGPVILELAQPEPKKPASLPVIPPDPQDSDASTVLAHVENAERPVAIAGTLAMRQDLSDQLNSLQIPIFSTAAAKGVANENGPFSAGVYTGVGLKLSPESSLIEQADLVVCIGMRPNEVLATRPFGTPSVNICAARDPGSDAFGFEAIAAPDATSDVLAALGEKSWGADEVAQANASIRRAMLSNRFLPAHVFKQTQSHFDNCVRGVFDTGYFCTIAEHMWHADRPAHCLMSGQGRYMGTGVPMALGAAIHDPSVPTVAFVGDGGIGPFVGEAKLAVERKLPLLFCLLTDGRFASIRTRSLQDGLTERPLTPGLPSWLAVMEGFGMPAYRAADEVAVADVLAAWDPGSGPAFLEIPFDPDPYEAMVKGIR